MRVWGPLYDIILFWNIGFSFLYVGCTIWLSSFNKVFFLILISGQLYLPDIFYFICPLKHHNEFEFRKRHINVIICAHRIIYLFLINEQEEEISITSLTHRTTQALVRVSDFQKFQIVQQKIEANSQKVICFSNRYLDVKIKPSEVPFVNDTYLYSPSQWIKWQSSVCKSNSVHVRFRLSYDWSVL